VLDGAFLIAKHFEQMGTNRVKTMMLGKPTVAIERLEQFETFRRAVYHGGCNCMIECHHGAGRHAFQQFVQGKDLRPIRVFSSCRFVMNRSHRRL
jgi:hypothetical protein